MTTATGHVGTAAPVVQVKRKLDCPRSSAAFPFALILTEADFPLGQCPLWLEIFFASFAAVLRALCG